MKDHISIEHAKKLHPKKKDNFISFINEIEDMTGLTFRIVQGLRTIDEQNKIYAQGRTTPGHIVTRAKGGQSFHNYGLAIDIIPIHEGVADWDYDFNHIVPIAEKHGLTWGGSWKDYDHFEDNLGHGASGWKFLINLPKDEHGYILI